MITLQEARKKSGLTQQQLADRLQVTNVAVSNWENAKALPSLDMRQEIQRILQANIFWNHDTPLNDGEAQALGRMFRDILERTNEMEAVRFTANLSRQQVRQLIRTHGYYQEPIPYPTANGLKIPE